jgi:hypothetical protein
MRNDGNDGGAGVFERARPALLSLAYCMLGSRSEAEDAVQDSFVRWRLWKKYRWVVIDLNGARGVVLEKEGAIVTASDLDRLQRGRGGYTDLHPSESRQTRESLQRRRHLRARTARMTTKESANE